MKHTIIKRILGGILAIVLTFALIPGTNGGRMSAAAFETYVQELSQLIQDNWDDDYISEIEFRIDDPTMTINGEIVDIDPGRDVVPYISSEGSTMLPLRVLSEAMDLDVSYNSRTSDIHISGDDVEGFQTHPENTLYGRRLPKTKNANFSSR